MVAINWYIRFKKRIEFLEDKNRKLLARNAFLERRMKKNEDNNTGTTGNREDNNVIKFG
jgi:cell division protein FtsB